MTVELLTRTDLDLLRAEIAELKQAVEALRKKAPEVSPWMTKAEVAVHFRYKSLASVDNLVRAGKIKRHYFNGRLRFSRSEVEGLKK